jgi:hypothetical protein
MTKEQVCPSAMPMSYLYQGDVVSMLEKSLSRIAEKANEDGA